MAPGTGPGPRGGTCRTLQAVRSFCRPAKRKEGGYRELCHSPNTPGSMVGNDWFLHRRMRATKQSGRQGDSEQRWLCTPERDHPCCWGCHKFIGASWRPDRLWEKNSRNRSSSGSSQLEDGESHAGTLTRRWPPGRWWGWGSRRRSSPRRPRARSSCSEPCTPPRTALCSHPSLRDRTGLARARYCPSSPHSTRDTVQGTATAWLSSMGLQGTSPSRRGEQPRSVPACNLWGAARGTRQCPRFPSSFSARQQLQHHQGET